jgi:hypothetical protein
MLIEEALYYQLVHDANVAAVASTRVYPMVIPQDQSLPAIAYQRVDGGRDTAHDGEVGTAMAVIQITAQAGTYETAKELMDLVKDSLIAFDGTMGGAGGLTVDGIFFGAEFDGYGMSTTHYTVRGTFTIRYRE